MLKVLQVALLVEAAIITALASYILVWLGAVPLAGTLSAVVVTYAGVVSLLVFGKADDWARRLLLRLWGSIAATQARAASSFSLLLATIVVLSVYSWNVRFDKLLVLLTPKVDEVVVLSIQPLRHPSTAVQMSSDRFEGYFVRGEQLLVAAESSHYHTSSWSNVLAGQLIALQLVRKSTEAVAAPISEQRKKGSTGTSKPNGVQISIGSHPTINPEWEPISGSWLVSGTTIVQSDENAHPALIVARGTQAAHEFAIDARRTGGNDGFSLVVGYESPNHAAWWDVGGYGGLKSIAEFSLPSSGVFSLPQTDTPFRIDSNHWYHVLVRRSGRHVMGLVDGVKIFEFDVPDQVDPQTNFGLRTWMSSFQFRNASAK